MTLTVKTYAQLSEAAQALSADRDARFLAGGTLLMRAVNEGDQSFDTIIRATDGAFAQVRAQGDRIVLGAGLTMSQILANRELEFLHWVARAIGGPAVRNMATVGGNLFAESPYGDFAVALLVLDATVTLAGAGGGEMPLEQFLAQRTQEPRRIVEAVAFRRPASGAFRFRKVSRVKPKGASVLSIAALLPQSGGRLSGVRIAYGAMGPTPLRDHAVERALEGGSLDEPTVTRAVASAAEGLDPPTDALASAWYRLEVAPVHLRRLLLDQ
jgi:CO/xanthine dehydrogenase FAD-binding subunit